MTRALALGVLLLSACPPASVHTTILIAGDSVKAVGSEFLAVNAQAHDAHAKGLLSDAQWGAWVAFDGKFKAIFPALVDSWQLAADASDVALAGKLLDSVGVLAAELAQLAADITAVLKGAAP